MKPRKQHLNTSSMANHSVSVCREHSGAADDSCRSSRNHGRAGKSTGGDSGEQHCAAMDHLGQCSAADLYGLVAVVPDDLCAGCAEPALVSRAAKSTPSVLRRRNHQILSGHFIVLENEVHLFAATRGVASLDSRIAMARPVVVLAFSPSGSGKLCDRSPLRSGFDGDWRGSNRGQWSVGRCSQPDHESGWHESAVDGTDRDWSAGSDQR